RYFRDRSWAVRVPRRLQENLMRVNGASQALQAELGRTPSVAEIAQRLGLEPEGVLERVMSHLTPRERRILALRFVEQLPQTEVAKRLGISQMHVSRLQRAAIEHLR